MPYLLPHYRDLVQCPTCKKRAAPYYTLILQYYSLIVDIVPNACPHRQVKYKHDAAFFERVCGFNIMLGCDNYQKVER